MGSVVMTLGGTPAWEYCGSMRLPFRLTHTPRRAPAHETTHLDPRSGARAVPLLLSRTGLLLGPRAHSDYCSWFWRSRPVRHRRPSPESTARSRSISARARATRRTRPGRSPRPAELPRRSSTVPIPPGRRKAPTWHSLAAARSSSQMQTALVSGRSPIRTVRVRRVRLGRRTEARSPTPTSDTSSERSG